MSTQRYLNSQSKDPKVKSEQTKLYTIFIGCIPGKTKPEDLLKKYSPLGEIFDINIKMKKKSAGSGYGTFNTYDKDLFKKVTGTPQKLHGRDIICREYLHGKGKEKYLEEANKKRVYIKPLDLSWSDDDIYNFFSKFGEIERAYAIRNSFGQSKGFGYVNFSSIEEANDALKKQRFNFGGNIIEIFPYIKFQDYSLKKNDLKNGVNTSKESESQNKGSKAEKSNSKGKRRYKPNINFNTCEDKKKLMKNIFSLGYTSNHRIENLRMNSSRSINNENQEYTFILRKEEITATIMELDMI